MKKILPSALRVSQNLMRSTYLTNAVVTNVPDIKPLNQQALFNLKLDVNPSHEELRIYNYCIPQKNEYDEIGTQRAIRNRSKLLGTFPLMVRVIENSPSIGKHLLKNFDQGESSKPTDSLKEHLEMSFASTAFMKRISHASSITTAKALYDITHEGIVDSTGITDEKTYTRRISDLPLPHSDREQYDAMYKILTAVNDSDLKPQIKSKIFFNTERRWTENGAVITRNFPELLKEYSQSIAKDLVLPEYIARYQETAKNSLILTHNPQRFQRYNDWFTAHTLFQVSDLVSDTILSKLSPQKLVENAERLDRLTTQINEARPFFLERVEKFKSEGNYQRLPEWHKIFPDQEINGCKFRALTTLAEISQEGREMNNCVGGLEYKCRAGTVHIIAGISPNGERFTFRLDGGHFGKVSKTTDVEKKRVPGQSFFASKEVQEAVNILCKRIDTNQITLNPLRGSINKDYTINDALGFDITSKEHRAAIFEAYREAHVLPAEISKAMKNQESFFEIIGLDHFLQQSVPESIKISKKNEPPSRIAAIEAAKIKKGPRELSYLD
ncbi:MAG: hypothetical protein V4694_00225 [Pseudomonadota bacterium]